MLRRLLYADSVQISLTSVFKHTRARTKINYTNKLRTLNCAALYEYSSQTQQQNTIYHHYLSKPRENRCCSHHL